MSETKPKSPSIAKTTPKQRALHYTILPLTPLTVSLNEASSLGQRKADEYCGWMCSHKVTPSTALGATVKRKISSPRRMWEEFALEIEAARQDLRQRKTQIDSDAKAQIGTTQREDVFVREKEWKELDRKVFKCYGTAVAELGGRMQSMGLAPASWQTSVYRELVRVFLEILGPGQRAGSARVRLKQGSMLTEDTGDGVVETSGIEMLRASARRPYLAEDQ